MLKIRVRNKIGDILAEYGQSQGWLMRELAKHNVVVDRRQISLWCNNKIQPSMQHLFAISKAMGIGIDELLEEVKNEII